jgi:hypothetical protein
MRRLRCKPVSCADIAIEHSNWPHIHRRRFERDSLDVRKRVCAQPIGDRSKQLSLGLEGEVDSPLSKASFSRYVIDRGFA